MERCNSLEERVLRDRIRRHLAGRLLVILLCLGFILAIHLMGGQGSVAPTGAFSAAYWTLVGVGLFTLAGFLLAETGRALWSQAAGQVAADILAISMLVFFTGIDQIFAWLYFLAVISAAMVLSLRAAMAAASVSTTMLAVISLAQFFAAGLRQRGIWLPAESAGGSLVAHVVYLVSFAVSLHVVAFLAGLLVRQLSGLRSLHEEILENMPGGVIAVDHNGVITFASRQASGLLGLARRDRLAGASYERALPSEVAGLVREALERGREAVREISARDRRVEVCASPLRNPRGGELRGAILTVLDVTVRDHLERMRAVAERFQAFAELSASIAHEIRNPLASIRGAAQELARGERADPDERALAEVLVRETRRIDRIITEFLEFAADRAVHPVETPVAPLAEEVALLLEARLRDDPARRVRIERECPADLIARMDADRMKQVLLNLGLNALDAVGPAGRIVLCARRDGAGRAVVLEVQDDGPGISSGQQARIFDPFYTTKQGGTGMGLAVAQKIVQAHGGQISVQSAPGQGATFRIWLPG